MLRRITLDDLKPGDLFGYSFRVEWGRRRFCAAEVDRVKGGVLFVRRAKCIGPVVGDVKAHKWEYYNPPSQSGYSTSDEEEAWELYVYDKEALWAAHCADALVNGT